jgi:hypothetical protein
MDTSEPRNRAESRDLAKDLIEAARAIDPTNKRTIRAYCDLAEEAKRSTDKAVRAALSESIYYASKNLSNVLPESMW